MPTKITRVASTVGLHARPASEFVARAKEAESVKIGRPGAPGTNGKSIAMVLVLGLAHNDEVEITVEGENAEEHLNALVDIVESAQ